MLAACTYVSRRSIHNNHSWGGCGRHLAGYWGSFKGGHWLSGQTRWNQWRQLHRHSARSVLLSTQYSILNTQCSTISKLILAVCILPLCVYSFYSVRFTLHTPCVACALLLYTCTCGLCCRATLSVRLLMYVQWILRFLESRSLTVFQLLSMSWMSLLQLHRTIMLCGLFPGQPG